MREVPWVAITPVVRVIRVIGVLRRMVPPGELLLSSAHHDVACPGRHPGSLKLVAVTMRLKDFVAWANREVECPKRDYGLLDPSPRAADEHR
ncbi:hypothetical protein [Streptomyces sp. x-19]|uniref:hypothetical protein n=1 Tax=Streptomyces sp. x-19 TaxID=2789280 RepID=UPI00397F6DB6